MARQTALTAGEGVDVMDHRGISAVAEAVTLVLERSWEPGLIEGVTPEFKCYRSKDFAEPMASGLSVLVHLVTDLDEVESALERVVDGTYGICQVCREPIDPARLQARPTARTCVRPAPTRGRATP